LHCIQSVDQIYKVTLEAKFELEWTCDLPFKKNKTGKEATLSA